MLRYALSLILSGTIFIMSAQNGKKVNTGKFEGPFTVPLANSTNHSTLKQSQWNIAFQSLPNEAEEHLFHVRELKEMKNEFKRLHPASTNASFKTRGNNPTIGINFRGNDLKSWTPTDNSIAISDSGIIVSCVNQGIEYYDTTGALLAVSQTWTDFVNDTTLKSAKFDPRVVYDKKRDRFIVVLLHGTTSSKSLILTCFSKTNNPIDGWNIYHLSGNPFSDTTWTDYPTIGINDDELFINGNRWGNPPNYEWKETYIYQVGLNEGFAGNPLSFGLWHQINLPDGNPGITLYPASNGRGESLQGKMFFAATMPDSGSAVYLIEIDSLQSSPNKTLTATQYSIPHFDVCADAFQKDPTTGFVDSLSTGSAWVQNAFYLHNTVHFTIDADIAGGWCGIHYGRIYIDSNKAVMTSYGETGTDMCYPAVASFGYDSTDRSVAIAFLRSDSSTTKMPEVDIISCDKNMVWTGKQTVKKGDTSVNILYPPDYGIQPERWGDYTGIARKYVGGTPQVWLAGAFGANTPPRLNSYGTWIAQILSGDSQTENVPQEPIDKSTLKLYPNPTSDLFTLEFKNTKDGEVSIHLYDAAGRTIRTLFEDYLMESTNRISFNKLMLSSGNYFIVVSRDGKKIVSEKLTVR